jgi:hypothetical protein
MTASINVIRMGSNSASLSKIQQCVPPLHFNETKKTLVISRGVIQINHDTKTLYSNQWLPDERI